MTTEFRQTKKSILLNIRRDLKQPASYASQVWKRRSNIWFLSVNKTCSCSWTKAHGVLDGILKVCCWVKYKPKRDDLDKILKITHVRSTFFFLTLHPNISKTTNLTSSRDELTMIAKQSWLVVAPHKSDSVPISAKTFPLPHWSAHWNIRFEATWLLGTECSLATSRTIHPI